MWHDVQTEEKPRTIINLDAYEITALIWAMDEYIHNGQFAERQMAESLAKAGKVKVEL